MLSAHYTTLIELSDILCKGTGNIATLYKFGDESNLVSQKTTWNSLQNLS